MKLTQLIDHAKQALEHIGDVEVKIEIQDGRSFESLPLTTTFMSIGGKGLSSFIVMSIIQD